MTEVTEAPRFSKPEAEQFALKHYGLAARAEVLPSERDQNFLLTAADGRMSVLKIANVAEEVRILELQNMAMRHLAGPDEPVPCPQVIPSLKNRHIENVEDSNGRSHFLIFCAFIKITNGPFNPDQAIRKHDASNLGLPRYLVV